MERAFKRCISFILVLCVWLAAAPAAFGEGQLAGIVSADQLLDGNQVLFNDPAVEAAIKGSFWYFFTKDASKSNLGKYVEQLTLTDPNNAVKDLSVLQFCGNLKSLTISSQSLLSLEPLTKCKKLEQLYLTDCNAVDLEPLTRCKSLSMLFINKVPIDNLSILQSMGKLKTLSLMDTKVTDLTPVGSLKKLQILSLKGDYADYSPLLALQAIKCLGLLDANAQTVTTLVTAFGKKLDELVISGCALTTEACETIGQSPKLSTLTLAKVTGVDLAMIGQCKPLKSLVIQSTDEALDFGALAGLAKLSELQLIYIKGTSLQGLETLTKLKTLIINYADIKDLSPLGALAGLETLHIAGCRAQSYDFLTQLSQTAKLKELVICGTNFEDTGVLAGFTKLETLLLDDNPIADITALGGLQKLKVLSLYGIQRGVDLTPLYGLTKMDTMRLPETVDDNTRYALQNILSRCSFVDDVPDDYQYQTALFFGDPNPITREDRLAEEQKAAEEARQKAEEAMLAKAQEDFDAVSKQIVQNQETLRAAEADGSIPAIDGLIDADGYVIFTSPSLLTRIQESLGTGDAKITVKQMREYDGDLYLYGNEGEMVDLTPLQLCQNVKSVMFDSGSFVSFAPLLGMTALTSVSVYINGTFDVLPFTRLPSLTSLSFAGDAKPVNLSALSTCTGLEELEISIASASDVPDFSKLTNLTNLWLSGEGAVDISAISACAKLTKLHLGTPVTGQETLTELERLTELSLDKDIGAYADVLPKLQKVTTLELIGSDPSDALVQAVAQMPSLHTLGLTNMYNGKGIGYLPQLTNISALDIIVVSPLDLSVIAQCTNLTELTFSAPNNELNGDVSALGAMTWLKRLNLSYCQIADIKALGKLTNLEYLNLYHNDIKSFKPLTTCASLKELIVSQAQLDEATKTLQKALPNAKIWAW